MISDTLLDQVSAVVDRMSAQMELLEDARARGLETDQMIADYMKMLGRINVVLARALDGLGNEN